MPKRDSSSKMVVVTVRVEPKTHKLSKTRLTRQQSTFQDYLADSLDKLAEEELVEREAKKVRRAAEKKLDEQPSTVNEPPTEVIDDLNTEGL